MNPLNSLSVRAMSRTHPPAPIRPPRSTRRDRRRAAAQAAAAPAHQRRSAPWRPGRHGLRPGPRGVRRPGRCAPVRPGPGPGRDPASFDAALDALSHRIGLFAPRLATVPGTGQRNH